MVNLHFEVRDWLSEKLKSHSELPESHFESGSRVPGDQDFHSEELETHSKVPETHFEVADSHSEEPETHSEPVN